MAKTMDDALLEQKLSSEDMAASRCASGSGIRGLRP